MSRTNVLLLLTLCLILVANAGFSQGFYVTAGAGYSLGSGTQTVGANTSSDGTAATVEGVYGSYGEGFKFGASGGYMFNDNFGAELGFSYWLGKSIESSLKSPILTQASKTSGFGFVAVPSLVISADMRPVNPYARFGLVLGLLKTKQESSSITTGANEEWVYEESGNLALGFAGALGITVRSGGPVDFFAEVVLHSVTYSPAKIELTKYTVNGVDRLPGLQNTSADYKETVTSSDLNTRIALRRPFSSVGMAVGVKIRL